MGTVSFGKTCSVRRLFDNKIAPHTALNANTVRSLAASEQHISRQRAGQAVSVKFIRLQQLYWSRLSLALPRPSILHRHSSKLHIWPPGQSHQRPEQASEQFCYLCQTRPWLCDFCQRDLTDNQITRQVPEGGHNPTSWRRHGQSHQTRTSNATKQLHQVDFEQDKFKDACVYARATIREFFEVSRKEVMAVRKRRADQWEGNASEL